VEELKRSVTPAQAKRSRLGSSRFIGPALMQTFWKRHKTYFCMTKEMLRRIVSAPDALKSGDRVRRLPYKGEEKHHCTGRTDSSSGERAKK